MICIKDIFWRGSRHIGEMSRKKNSSPRNSIHTRYNLPHRSIHMKRENHDKTISAMKYQLMLILTAAILIHSATGDNLSHTHSYDYRPSNASSAQNYNTNSMSWNTGNNERPEENLTSILRSNMGTLAEWENVTTVNSTEGNVTTKKARYQCPGPNYQHDHLKIICMPFLTVAGITGNLLSFIVMGSAVYRRKSYSYYLRALAIFDCLTLIIESVLMGNEISMSQGTGNLLHYHNIVSCKLSNFLESVIYLMSSWLVVAFTLDRYIAVCHPLQRARLCTETRAKIAIVVLLLLTMASQGFRFYYIERLDRTMPCHAPKELRKQYFLADYVWYGFTLRFAVPFVVIVICNGLVIFHVQRMHKIRQTEERDKKRRAHLAITTLVAICAVFSITLLPNAIISMIILYQRSQTTFCVLVKLDTPFQMIRMLNYSTNFILYGLSGRLFRSELRRLLSCRRFQRNGTRTSSPKTADRKGLKVNFRSVQRRLPGVGGGMNGAPCRRVVDNGPHEMRMFLAGPHAKEVESEV